MSETAGRIETVDGDETLSCKQKVEQLNAALSEFEVKSVDKLEAVRVTAAQVSPSVDHFDVKQLDDQIKLLDRRQKDVCKRFERKLSTLNKAMENQDVILQEALEIRKWIREKCTLLEKPPLLGFEVHASEKQIQNLKVSEVCIMEIDRNKRRAYLYNV